MDEEIKVIKEVAKATQEVAKTTSKAIDAGQKVGSFISKLIKGPLTQGIGIFEDKLKYMRWERLQRFIKRSEDFEKSQDAKTIRKAIPLKLAVPLLQAASLEDNDYLQDMWAKLIANGSSNDSGVELHRSYINILEQLSFLEVKILEQIYITTIENSQKIFLRDIQKEQKVSDQMLYEAMDNLMRLYLSIVAVPKDGEILSHHHLSLTLKSQLGLSTLGTSFIHACRCPILDKGVHQTV